ncbi:hypothetical protein F4821DRAFT_265375 [Hypoxylon rubiginosum]|uniref:Uncharacterized protein n=1 Tax=Hypoxylon rubiginosum TaxID=110542 RepID=A0ACC0CKM9_9PEZI|nr:hypothetical protein F4821DRAFT_265375 [Hypoxylon rubiginosum]
MAKEVASAIEQGKELRLGRLRGRNPCTAIFVWGEASRGDSDNEPAFAFTSSQPKKHGFKGHDASDIDRHVYFEPANDVPLSQIDREQAQRLQVYQNMCRAVRLPVHSTENACVAALKEVLVNIVDYIDTIRMERPVEVWTDFAAFRKYTLSDDKRFDSHEARADGGFLAVLLRRLKLLLKKRYVDVEGRDFRGITALDEALSPTSGSPEIAILLLQHGARVPRGSSRNILDLANSLCQTSHAVTLYNTLRRYRLLARIFQVLFDHCSAVALEDGDDVTRAFLADSPTLIVEMIKATSGHKLTNEKVLERMRDQFFTTKVRPRKAARSMRNWWMGRNIRRRQQHE